MFNYRDGWIIRDTSFSMEEEYTKASCYAMSNGYFGNRGTLEEVSAGSGPFAGNYVNGIYDAPGGNMRECEVVNIQNWASIRLWLDEEPFDISNARILEFERWMDFREAVLHRRMRVASPKGTAVLIESERFVSKSSIHCGLIRWKATAEDVCRIRIESGIDADVYNIHKYHFKKFYGENSAEDIYLEAETGEVGYRVGVACAEKTVLRGGSGFRKRFSARNRKYICNCYDMLLGKGGSFQIEKYAAIYTSRDDVPDVRLACLDGLSQAMEAGYGRLREKHAKEWTKLWKQADMVIEGDDRAQYGIRFSIYHLLNSAPYHSSSISYPARSLSGQDHRGSIFWDTEIFIEPFFIFTLPEVARNMMHYRYRTLDGARRKAASFGYRGAFYAWESHENGDEKCHSRVFRYAKTGRLMVNHFRDAQIHISADISYCLWQYYEMTGDTDFLVLYGAEIAMEIARFYASRVKYDRRLGYVLKGVLGPDEYHEMVDDNAFTNMMAREAISIAFKAMEAVRTEDPGALAALTERLDVSGEEMALWRDVIEKIHIPAPGKDGLIEQFRGYFKLEDCSVEEAKGRRTKPGEYLGGIHGICAGTQVMKQADVIMMMYLLSDRFTNDVIMANWEYYEPRTEHGSSLSTMAYALVAADIGMMEWSYKYFLRTAFIDLEAKGFYSNHGVHPCSLGGAWLTVVNGYFGIRPSDMGIRVREPHIPEQWTHVSFTISWHGSRVSISYENGGCKAELVSGKGKVPFIFSDRTVFLTRGNNVEF